MRLIDKLVGVTMRTSGNVLTTVPLDRQAGTICMVIVFYMRDKLTCLRSFLGFNLKFLPKDKEFWSNSFAHRDSVKSLRQRAWGSSWGW